MDEPRLHGDAEGVPAPSKQHALEVVLAGGSGQVGRMLARQFQVRGAHVTVLTRSPYAAPYRTIHWDGEHPGAWVEALDGADVCINLTGHTINCRPTRANRELVLRSRIESTLAIHRAIASLTDPPWLWMNASACTLYDRLLDDDGVDLPRAESDYHAAGFTTQYPANVVRAWEDAFFAGQLPHTRRVALRSGLTFSPVSGNVFAVLARLVQFSLGGAAGSGRQFVPWIHEADYARAVDFLIARDDLEGPFNLAAPNPLPNRELMAALREAMNMPNGIPAPAFGIKLGAWLFGSNPSLVLDSCRAVPARLMGEGFHFLYPDWPEAALDLARKYRHRHNF